MSPFAFRPGAHVELFEHGQLVHSSRPDEFLASPCPLCGLPLGVVEPVVMFGAYHAHRSCVVRRPRA